MCASRLAMKSPSQVHGCVGGDVEQPVCAQRVRPGGWLRESGRRHEPVEQGHLEHLRVVEPVSPQAVFTPRVAVVGAHESIRLLEPLENRCEVDVDEFEAGALLPAALLGVVALLVCAAWALVDLPCSTLRASRAGVSLRR
jgi:hypothetical protein